MGKVAGVSSGGHTKTVLLLRVPRQSVFTNYNGLCVVSVQERDVNYKTKTPVNSENP